MKVAVCIPIYKTQPSEFEILSLQQCLKILSNHPLIFFAPATLNIERYSSLCGNINFRVVRFEDKYFENIDGYNELMLSSHFYRTFLKFKFILIYQLDAFVFKDELDYWCDKNYDYIGAPHDPYENATGKIQFLKNYETFLKKIKKYTGFNHKISNVGNGGLSLRKTRSFYYLLKFLRKKAKKWIANEDLFFKYWGNVFYPLFKLPPDKIAINFSIETDPKEHLEKLNYRLPFGCHAFEKYSWETWRPFIQPITESLVS